MDLRGRAPNTRHIDNTLRKVTGTMLCYDFIHDFTKRNAIALDERSVPRSGTSATINGSAGNEGLQTSGPHMSNPPQLQL